MRICIDYAMNSNSFEEGYQRIHQRFRQFNHCMIYQEAGTLINMLKTFGMGYANKLCRGMTQKASDVLQALFWVLILDMGAWHSIY